jgi:glutamate synthase (NADPH/NADH) large chain
VIRHRPEGLPDHTIFMQMAGTGGQSFGAFLASGITMYLIGDANDYTGKGLSGGRVVVRPSIDFRGDSTRNIIVGNTVLYGAIAGEAYFEGVAGERFAVRNSGAIAVVEGTGDHACEYMTGGVVVTLGATGRNFGAGMSGGVAYVYDPTGSFRDLCNLSMVAIETVSSTPSPADDPERPRQKSISAQDSGMGDMLRFDAERLKILIERHLLYTGSARARSLLDNWNESLKHFVKVMPTDYRRALLDLKAERQVAAE